MRGLSARINAAATSQAQPSARKGFPSRRKKKNHRPANQTGALMGSIARISWPRNASGVRSTLRPLRRMLACNSRNGKWRWTFHSRLGRKIRNATRPAIQSHLVRRKRRSGVSSSPAMMPKPKISMECLFSSPIPASRPNHSQRRVSPVRTIRMTSQAQPIQNKGSNAFMVSKLSRARKPGAARAQRAAKPWAKRFPPNSRAIRPVSSTLAAPARAGMRRMAGRDSPSNARATLATRATSGGWST